MSPDPDTRNKDFMTLMGHNHLPTSPEQMLPPGTLNFEEIGRVMDNGYWVFRVLPTEELVDFKKEARDNYTPFSIIEGVWHPIYQLECVLINHKHSLYKFDKEGDNDSAG